MYSAEDEIIRVPVEELERAEKSVNTDFTNWKSKIYEFPASLHRLGRRYVDPMVVSIGPHHHGKPHLQRMEDVKRAAAKYFCEKTTKKSVQDMFVAVLAVVEDARGVYYDQGQDRMPGMDDDDFAAMMLYDGCFLLQCMVTTISSADTDPRWLRSAIFSNLTCIHNDIMLLENQLPWMVVDALVKCSGFNGVELFIAMMGEIFQVDRDLERKPLILDGHNPPHLLGLLKFYVSSSVLDRNPLGLLDVSSMLEAQTHADRNSELLSASCSAIELAEIGINLRASRTAKFMDMGIRRGLLLGDLFLPPLFLDDTRTCWLVNMAAFEVCTAISLRQDDQKAAVCSYIAVLAMLMDREEDVHELRTRRLVQGQLSNRETLDFFKNLTKHLGYRYVGVMKDIEAYKRDRWIRVMVHAFLHNNFKTIITLFSIIGVLAGIFRALLSLKLER